MKKLFSLAIGLATAFTIMNAQTTLDIDKFKGISLSIPGTVILKAGSQQEVEVSGPSELIDDLKLTIKDGNWTIKYHSDENNRNADPLNFTITSPSIKSIGVSGSGSVITDGKLNDLDNLNLAVSGSGSIEYDGDAESAHFAISGNGSIDVDCSSEDTHVAVSGSGNISIKGNADRTRMASSGSGKIEGSGFKTKYCKASISGSSNLSAEVTDELDVTISGSGKFKYKGNPDIRSNKNSRKGLVKMK